MNPINAQVTNIADWKQTTKDLQSYCRDWFKNKQFSQLRNRILTITVIKDDPSVPVIFCCDHDNPDWDCLQRLPYHIWELYDKLPNSEFALSAGYSRPVAALKRPFRVLAIFGSSKGGLNFKNDANTLKFLKRNGAEITQVFEPSKDELDRLLNSEMVWDILFFAGHSSSDENGGQIIYRGNKSLDLENLRPYLVPLASTSLKLAIFNSCDGLGIASFLTSIGISNVIAMKEPVPDDIACLFLIEFLKELTKGTQLSQAVRRARQRLALEQDEVPSASWLPVVFLNPSAPELILPKPRALVPPKIILGATLVSAIAAISIALAPPNFFCNYIPPLLRKSLKTLECPLPPQITDGGNPISSKVELSGSYISLKENGIREFAAGNYLAAKNLFDSLRKQARANLNNPVKTEKDAALAALQDPMVLIYRNNAIARSRFAEDSSVPLHTIAFAAPLNNDAGMSMAFGVAQAHDVAVNTYGFNLQIVVANDMNNREQAQRIAKDLSNNKQVLAVVGHYTSPNSCAALSVYSPNNLVQVSPASTMVNLPSNPDCGGDPNQVFFRTVSSTRVEAETLIQYLVDDLNIPQPKVAVFYNANELFSRDMYVQFGQVLNSYGGELISAFDLSDPNFKANTLPPQVMDADAIAVLPDGGTDSRDALEKGIAITRLNNGDKPVLGANTLYSQGVIDQGKKVLVNRLFIAVDWHPRMCSAESFAEQVRKYWGGDLNRLTALSYEAVQVLASILSLSPSGVTRQDIRQKLFDTGIRGEAVAPMSDVFSGKTISFDSRGDRIEITTRGVVTVDENLRFSLVDNGSCS